MQKKRNLNFACSVLYAAYYILFYMVSMMFSSYLVESGFDKTVVTTMSSISSIVLLFAKPLFSAVVDKSRCRLLSCVFIAAMAVGSAVFFFSPQRTMLQVVIYTLLASACCLAFMELGETWVAKLIKESGDIDYGKTRAFGSASYAVTGLVYGGALTAFGYEIAPWCIFALLAVLAAVTFYMPDPQRNTAADKKQGGVAKSWLSLLRQPSFLAYMVFGTVAGQTLGMLDNFTPVLISERGGSAFHIGLASFVMAGIEFFLLRMFTRVADRVGTTRIFTFGILGFAVKTLVLSLMPTPALIIAGCVTQTVSFCLYFPGRMRVLQEEVPQESLAGAFAISGIYSSLLSSLVVNPITGHLSESIGTAGMMRCFAAACVVAGAGYHFAMRRINAKREAAAQ